jgi:hypothetical protein
MKGLPYFFRNKHLSLLTDTGHRNGTNVKRRVLSFLYLPPTAKVDAVKWALYSHMSFRVMYSKLGHYLTEDDIALLEKEKAHEEAAYKQRMAEQKKHGKKK